ncbi:MAG TPA: acetylglutamate kinase, partial [Firmicutes bacterium]|nr:acetylglutamate kinase [Bacillota bacterium]
MQELINKAQVLVEALPYIKKFAGEYFVIKYGGQAMVSRELKQSVVLDIALLQHIGVKPVVVHGGGKEVTALMERLGLKASFVGGLRVTDRETMELVEMVLAGKVNSEIVSLFNCSGGEAVGLSGKDAALFLGRKRPPVKVREGGKEQLVDLGYAGEITQVNT